MSAKKFLILPFLFLLQAAFAKSDKGEIKGPFSFRSKIYPGTDRNYWIYVPKQYDKVKPACLMVVQDGLGCAKGWRLPEVLDSLITIKEVPVMIGIFIDHGTVNASEKAAYPRYNRSFEYDALGDRYSQFLTDEILPEVSKSYNISPNPNDRSIAGASSGAICAFNVAWERPDAFRRVFSSIGTYVGLRGAEEFSTLVRKSEPKPLRVFLQDGRSDLNIYAGDWWTANQGMLSALSWAGYEVNHSWGEGGHDSKHTSLIIADALKWLWKDYPQAITRHKGNHKINPTIEGEDWKPVNLPGLVPRKLAVDKSGSLYFSEGKAVYKLDEAGKATPFIKLNGIVGGITFGPGERLYVVDLTHRKIVETVGGKVKSLIKNVDANYLTASSKGLYFSLFYKYQIGYLNFSKNKTSYVTLPRAPAKATGLSLSAEQTFLNVGLDNHVFGYSFAIQDTGTLAFGQDYIHYHIPYGERRADSQGMTVDSDNLLYTSTNSGIQISDQLGRVNFILKKPTPSLADIKLAGADFKTLYALSGGKLYSRKLSAKGVLSWQEPVKPAKPGL